MLVARAPLRISIAGGGTDLPFYSSKFGGDLVSAAIDKYNYIILEEREFYNETFIRYMQNEVVKDIKDIKHTRVKAALEYNKLNEPIEITSLADVPSGTGLGSSSTYLVALLKAIHTYKGEDVSKKEVAEEAAHIEMGILKEPIGKHDQYMASFGGIRRLKIDKNGSVNVSVANISQSVLYDLSYNMLMFNTGVKRDAINIISEQKINAESEEAKMELMHIIKDIGKKIICALEEGDLTTFGKCLNDHWNAKKKFSNNMSSTIIDRYYNIGIENGALGGKIVGAGGGGFLLFYCEDKKRVLKEAMINAGLKELSFYFDFDGVKIVYDGR